MSYLWKNIPTENSGIIVILQMYMVVKHNESLNLNKIPAVSNKVSNYDYHFIRKKSAKQVTEAIRMTWRKY